MNLMGLVLRLEKAETTRQAEILFSDYLQGFGFQHFAFTYYSGHTKTGQKLQYDFVSEALRPWHMHYLEQAYADVDRTLEETHIFTLPVYWDVQEQLKTAKNKRENRIRLESIEFGIDKGLSLPVHGPGGDFASLTLHQFRHETTLKNYLALQFEWLSAAQVFYHYIRKILNLNKPAIISYHLTRREEQCLALTAQGWRVEQIAKHLKISVRTVNFHIQNANKKMGMNNKYQAAHKYFAKT